MSAQIRIMQADEADQGFGLLRDIVEMVKNPKAIDEAYEIRRKAAELSADEIADAAKARALISQAEALRDEINKRETVLSEAQDQQTKKAIDFEKHVEEENERLAAWEAMQKEKETAQSETAQKQKENADALAAQAKVIQDGHTMWEAQYADKLAKIADIEGEQKAEGERLSEWADKLKAKAAKLSELAQSDG